MRMSHSSAPLALRIPPAGLNPTAWLVSSRYSRIWRVITTPTGGEARGDGGDRDAGPRERRDRRRHVAVIDAHRGDHDAELGRAQRLEEVAADRPLCLGAQPQHVGRSVVALERREVDAGDGAEQPGGLPFLLDGAPGRDGGGAPLHGRAVHAHRADPVEVERDARVALAPCRHAERSLVLLFGFHRPAFNLRDWRRGAAWISWAASLSYCRVRPCDRSRVAAPRPAGVRAEAARAPREPVPAPVQPAPREPPAPASWVAAPVPRSEQGAPLDRGARWEGLQERAARPAQPPVRAVQLVRDAQRERPPAAARRAPLPAPVAQSVWAAPPGRQGRVAPRRVPRGGPSRAGGRQGAPAPGAGLGVPPGPGGGRGEGGR